MTQRNGSKAAARLDSASATQAGGAPVYPARLTTVARAPRLLGLALALAMAACGGGRAHEDSYRHATLAQERCCEGLAGGARDQCLGTVVRIDDPAVARSETNQATFECVEDHFVCDGATGRATRESAQAQLDCIQDLGQ